MRIMNKKTKIHTTSNPILIPKLKNNKDLLKAIIILLTINMYNRETHLIQILDFMTVKINLSLLVEDKILLIIIKAFLTIDKLFRPISLVFLNFLNFQWAVAILKDKLVKFPEEDKNEADNCHIIFLYILFFKNQKYFNNKISIYWKQFMLY